MVNRYPYALKLRHDIHSSVVVGVCGTALVKMLLKEHENYSALV